ncbi:hypothetical protein N7532_010024 [Penicillium argentinense]|uniref:Poly [ADP-ribose] polymerase n=1 Tax=Penicillium argentinense TaxID=1131581 RepID=A0A9W9ENT9_9EURO|nr:uncharacterized protein N7532_010024 [Penicillium argentinense]KAJ5085253.1 hypothetical protein N7532_010024 [Penicillium argentinense]
MAPTSFRGCEVAVVGTFPGYKHSDLEKLITNLGADFIKSISITRGTHLIATEEEFKKKGHKYKRAEILGLRVVSLDWLLNSIDANRPLPSKKFLLTSRTGNQAPGIAGEWYTPKSSRQNSPIPQEDSPDTANSPSRKRAKDQEESDEAEGLTKKQKDPQKANFKTVVVPVDGEGEWNMPCATSASDVSVFIDEDRLIWDATLSRTEVGANNNKFYRLQILLLQDRGNITYNIWNRWGRVGEKGQCKMMGDGTLKTALAAFNKKFKEKTGLNWVDRQDSPKASKYTFLQRDYEGNEEVKVKEEPREKKPPAESALSKPLQDLMAFLFNQDHFINAMAEMKYDAKKLPLGNLSQKNLDDGFSVLKDLSELIQDPTLSKTRYGVSFNKATETLTNRFLTIIPHDFQRQRPPIIDTELKIKAEVDLLEALTEMDVANKIYTDSLDSDQVNALDRQFKGLGMKEMTQLDHNSYEFRELSNYLKTSRGDTHGNIYYRVRQCVMNFGAEARVSAWYMIYSHKNMFQVIDIFRIERDGEEERFSSSQFAKIQNSNRRLLWHGSRSTNFAGILSQGLRIAPPEAPVNGYMFGKGVYLADTSTKSANYTCHRMSGGMGLLLLCDAELGEPMLELVHADSNAETAVRNAGKIATLGRGMKIPGGWKDAGCISDTLKGVKMPDAVCGMAEDHTGGLIYNEYIVYDVKQIRQRYLFYVHM